MVGQSIRIYGGAGAERGLGATQSAAEPYTATLDLVDTFDEGIESGEGTNPIGGAGAGIRATRSRVSRALHRYTGCI